MESNKKQRMSNQQIVIILKEVLAAMEVKNANKFKIRAYQNAISVIENLTTSVQDMWEDKRLGDIPGIGATLEQHFNDLFETGVVKDFDSVKEGLPQGMFALLGLRGIGAKKAFKLANHFKLVNRETAVEKLKEHAEKGEIQELDSFGEKSQADILDAINQAKKTKNEKQRMLLIRAEQIVERIINYMKDCPGIEKIDALGSLRRRNPTVGDIDVVVATTDPEAAIEHFIKFPESGETLVRGDKKAVIVLTTDVQVDLRVATPQAYGAMLQYNTGSKQHNVLLRTYALEKGMSLSEYGIKEKDKIHEFKTEEAFYKHMRLPYIPPELRQGVDEIDLARADKLPNLIELKDIKGDLHTHTTFSDGTTSMQEMVDAAIEKGYEYIGISDHAPSTMSRGHDEVQRVLQEQLAHAEAINKKQNAIKVLVGLEVNILADATLGLEDEFLKQLDYAIASIHTAFTQDRDTVTKRIIAAIENPYITFIGHPSGRLLNERDGCDIDWKKVFEALISNDKIIEINSQPNRLDLSYDLVREAIKKGIKLIINTDSHAPDQLNHMKYGIDVARRGFSEKQNIINTLPYSEFVKVVKKR